MISRHAFTSDPDLLADLQNHKSAAVRALVRDCVAGVGLDPVNEVGIIFVKTCRVKLFEKMLGILAKEAGMPLEILPEDWLST